MVLLDVWATWCEPCLDALPHSQQLLERFATRGFEVYAINIDADPRPIASFLKEAQVTLPVVLDPEGRQAEERLKVSLMPTILLIDKRGKVRSVREGFDEEQLVKWTSEIEALLNEP